MANSFFKIKQGLNLANYANEAALSGIPNPQVGDLVTVGSGAVYTYNGSNWVDVGSSGSVVSVNGQTGVVSLDTGDVPEDGNLYFTDGRAQSAAVVNSTAGGETDKAPSVSAIKAYISSLPADGVTSVNGDSGPAVSLDTGDIPEASNLYFTDGRAQSAAVVNSTAGSETDKAPSVSAIKAYISSLPADGVTSVNGDSGPAVSLDSGEIPEGSNLYFTDVRAQTAAVIDSSAGSQTDKAPSVSAVKAYVAASSPVLSVAGKTGAVTLSTSDVSEGTNLYFSDVRAQTAAVVDSTAGSELNQAPSVHATNELVTNAVALEAAARAAADALLIPLTQKATAGGVATLDINGLIPTSQLPPLSIKDTFVVSSEAQMLALTAQVGDVAVRTDINKTLILQSEPSSTLANWIEIIGSSGVTSVNGDAGPTVSLSTSNISEGSNLYFTDARAKLATVVNSSAGSETDQAMSASAAKMFTSDSVQTETLARQAADALLIPLTQKGVANGVAALDGSGLVPSSQLPAYPSVPVTSVNTQTGAVVLDTDNISESPSATNLWFTTARSQTAAVVDSTAGSETDKAPSVSAIKAYISSLPADGVTSVNGDSGPAVSLDSGEIPEGSNLYFTDGRAQSAAVVNSTAGSETDKAASVSAMKAYVSSLPSGGITSVNGDSGPAVSLDTGDIPEAGNLYFTDGRAQSAAVVNSTAGGETDKAASVSAVKAYVAASSPVLSVAGKTGAVTLSTSDVSEGTNLYFTDTRARAAITGAASSIAASNLTASRALASDASGKVAVSSVTSTELGFLSGVTSAIQTQFTGKLNTTGGALTGALTLNAQNQLRFADSDSSNYVAFQSPAVVSANVTWTLPSADGSSGQYLSTNGSGTLSWSTQSFTASRAIVSSGTGALSASSVTSTELGFLSGVTSAIQTQFTGKLNTTGGALTGALTLNAQNQLRFADSDSSNYVSFQSPAVVSANVAWTLPAADGTSGQSLTTNGSGTLSWSSPSLDPTATLTTGGYALSSSGIVTKEDFLSSRIVAYASNSNGTIKSSLIIGNSVYVGGFFTAVGKASDQKIAYGVKINSSTAAYEALTNNVLFNGIVYCSVVSGDFIYVGGSFTTYNGQAATCLAKISLLTGALDTTFDTSTGFNSTVNCLALDGVGNLFVGGSFTTYKGTTRQRIAKLNAATGALDATFDSAAGSSAQVNSVVCEGTQFIYIGGSFTTYKGTTRERIAKINASNATLDTTFDSASGFDADVNSIFYPGDGTLFVGGNFTAYKGTTRQRVARLFSNNAAIVTSFDTASGFDNAVRVVVLDSTFTYLYVGGNFTTYKGTARQYIARINISNGSLDATFNSASGFGGGFTNVEGIALDGSGNLYACGGFTTYKSASREGVVKMSASTAAIDSTFDAASGANRKTWAISLYSTSLFLGGEFGLYKTANNQVTRQNIAKFSILTGAVDTTFDSASGFSTTVNKLIYDGTNIIAAGGFTTYKGTARQGIAKINPTTAALDATFDSASGFTGGAVNDIVIDSSGNIYCGGVFSLYKATTRQYAAKINGTTAALDTTFDTTTGFDNFVEGLYQDGAGNLFVAGWFTTYKGTSRSRIAKIDASTASLITAFNNTTIGSGQAYGVSSDGSGNIFVYGNIGGRGIFKANSTTGALITTFDTSVGTSSSVNAMKLDGSGNLYIVGGFTTFNGFSRLNLAKINATTAVVDPTFVPTTGGFSNTPACVEIDPYGNIFIGGRFETYGSSLAFIQVTVSSVNANIIAPSTALGSFSLQSSDNGKVIVVNSSSAVSVTVPSGLSSSYRCQVIQSGAGQVTFSASGTTVNSFNGLKIAGQNGKVDLIGYASNVFNVSGNTAV